MRNSTTTCRARESNGSLISVEHPCGADNLNEWGIVKGSLYKTIGNGYLTWTELEEVVLDVEVAVNNRPLGYIQDDV